MWLKFGYEYTGYIYFGCSRRPVSRFLFSISYHVPRHDAKGENEKPGNNVITNAADAVRSQPKKSAERKRKRRQRSRRKNYPSRAAAARRNGSSAFHALAYAQFSHCSPIAAQSFARRSLCVRDCTRLPAFYAASWRSAARRRHVRV